MKTFREGCMSMKIKTKRNLDILVASLATKCEKLVASKKILLGFLKYLEHTWNTLEHQERITRLDDGCVDVERNSFFSLI